MASLPRLGLLRGEAAATGRLQEIPGMVPPLTNLPPGCAFAPRCPRADERCASGESALRGKNRGPLGRMLASRSIQWARP